MAPGASPTLVRARTGAEFTPPLVLLGGLVALQLVLLLADPDDWALRLLLVLSYGGMLVVVVRSYRWHRRQPWRVRIDADGITVPAGPAWITASGAAKQLPWPSIHSARARRPTRRLRWLPWLSEKVVIVQEKQAAFALRASIEPASTIISTRYLDQSAEEILRALQQHAPPPIRSRLQVGRGDEGGRDAAHR